MFGRKIRITLDLLKEFGGKKDDEYKCYKGSREIEFKENENCFARDNKNSNKRS